MVARPPVVRTSVPAISRQPPFPDSAAVRKWMVEQLRLDLVGPGPGDSSLHAETLAQAPARWYLTGYLVPRDAPDDQRVGDADSEGDMDGGDDSAGADDQGTPDKASARPA